MNGNSRALGRIVVIGLAFTLAACGPPSIEESLEDARASIAASDFAEATIHVRNVLQRDSTHLEARLMQAEISWQTGDFQAARLELERARDVDAPPAVYALQLARVYTELREPELALEMLDTAGPVADATADAALVRTDAWIALGDFGSAELALDAAGEAGATEADVDLRRARIAFARGDVVGAREAVAAALAANPNHTDALALSGSLAVRQGDYPQAVRDYRRAIDLHRATGRFARTAPLLMGVVETEIARGDLDAAGAAVAELGALAPEASLTLYASGLVAFRAGRYEDAVTVLRRAAVAAPEEVRIQSLLGAAQLAVGNLGQAEQQFQSILSRIRDDSASLQLLVETRLRQDRPQAALDAFASNPAAVNENILGLVMARARAYLALDDPANAIPSLERALALSPGNQSVALQLVDAYTRIGDSDAASEALRRASDLSADAELSANAQVLIATLQDEGPEAAARYVEGVRAEKPGAIAEMTAAIYHQLTGDAAAALAAVDAALAADPELLEGHVLRGGLLQERGDTEGAKVAFDNAIAIEPGNATALGARAVLAGAEQDYTLAADLFGRAYEETGIWTYVADRSASLRRAGVPSWSEPLREWLAENPNDVVGRLFLADQLRLSGENAAAVDAYEEVIALDASNLGALNNAAWLGSQLGRESAVDHARRAVELAPDNGALLDTLGWVLVRASQPAEGRQVLERATQLLPGVAEIQYHLAVAQADAGDATAARQTLDRVLAGAEVPAEIRGEAQRLRDSL